MHKKNIILVHGAWHGAWCWERVVPLLRPLANVYAIELPGRAFEVSSEYKKITLKNYVETVETCLTSLAEPAILVGHSMAGLVISQVAEHYPEKIEKLIYVAAFIPHSGECLFDITKTFAELDMATELISEPLHNKMDIKRSAVTQQAFYNQCAPEWAEKALAQLSPEPLRAFTTPVTLTSAFGSVKKHYIKCTEDKALSNQEQDKMIAKTNITVVHELHTDHSPFFSQPDTLVKKGFGLYD